MGEKELFDVEMIKSYPRSHRKITLAVRPYNLNNEEQGIGDKGQTTYISPYGLEFQVPKNYPDGTLLKINVTIPDYWNLKQNFVDYNRIDTPGEFRILAKVIKSEDVGKRGKKKLVLVQTVNIDEVDEKVLKTYLQEGK